MQRRRRSANAGVGFGVELLSGSVGFGDDSGLPGSLVAGHRFVDGGGSIKGLLEVTLVGTTGSGRDGIGSSADEVSIVI